MPTETIINEVITLHGFNVKLNITPGSTTAEAKRAIDTIGAALNTAEGSAERLRHAMGRLLNHVNTHELYKPEFDTFEAFTEEVVRRHRLSRATLRDAMMTAARLPKLTPEQAEKIPMTNLTLVARAAKVATPAKIRTMLKEAETMSRADLKEDLERRGLIVRRNPAASTEGKVAIRVLVTKRTAAQWEKFVNGRDAAEVFADIVASVIPTVRRRAA